MLGRSMLRGAVIIMTMLLLQITPTQAANKPPPSDAEREHLADKMAAGFVTAIRKESKYWWECGVPTPREQWLPRAKTMANALLDALDEFNVKVNPWGPWGVIYHESRGNRCAVGPNPRKVAYRKGLIEQKQYYMWTEEEVLSVVNHRQWGKRVADLGLGQVVWRRYARIKENGRVRIPTAQEMLSVENGARVLAYGMLQRQHYKNAREWKPMPWLFWPGSAPDWDYGMTISRIVKRMGGPAIRP